MHFLLFCFITCIIACLEGRAENRNQFTHRGGSRGGYNNYRNNNNSRRDYQPHHSRHQSRHGHGHYPQRPHHGHRSHHPSVDEVIKGERLFSLDQFVTATKATGSPVELREAYLRYVSKHQLAYLKNLYQKHKKDAW